jgi:hypothetical protein
MVFGHNSNIKLGAATLHVQTEDRGLNHALIDTTVYYQGRVLHRRTNNYLDLLPLNEDSEHALKLRVDEQHRSVLEEIRQGVLELNLPAPHEALKGVPPVATATAEATKAAKVEPPASQKTAIAAKLQLELLNARSWLSNKQARLLVSVKDEAGQAVSNAKVEAGIAGAGAMHCGQSGAEGQVTIAFEMPSPMPPEAALEITAEIGGRTGHLRFGFKAKPKVPAVS